MVTYGVRFEEALSGELRAERARRNMTEAQIAQRLGIHRVSVSRYLSGVRHIPISVFAELCQILDVDTLEIVSRAEIAARKAMEEDEKGSVKKPSKE
ncbi:MAG: helix-turn-helix transcriptional regulator [Bifidobacteriaceae bacterium]|jgi:transcriptional regulator with XRE-family HTH domain|nr:helix-turn-helix transcriptional regulator [Bifidobacteriaceae bacterium]